MNAKKTIALTMLSFFAMLPLACFAEDPLPPSEYEEHPAVENNLGALGSSDSTADIASESGGANGTEEGEITIFSDSSGIRVYSGANKVEMIPTNADGWVGSYTVESSQIRFHPTGRPELECPAQDSNNGWFGPCKLPQVSNG